MDGADVERVVFVHDPVERPLFERLRGERRRCTQPHAEDAVLTDLVHVEDEGVPIDEIPRVAGEFAAHVVDDPRRAEKREAGVPSQKDADESVEADKVVDVRV